jgi:hypothetical protein
MSRSRSRDASVRQLKIYHVPSGTVSADEGGYFEHETCVDDLGMSTDHPLTLTKKTVSGMALDWLVSPLSFKGVGATGAGDLVLPAAEQNGLNNWLAQFTAQKIAASTAPLKPALYLFTGMFEARDFPLLLMYAGDLLLGFKSRRPVRYLAGPRALAAHTLAFQFGWGPILQDLTKLLDVVHLILARQREIGELNSGKVVRRTVRFGRYAGGFTDTETVYSTFSVIVTLIRTVSHGTEAWATIHWQLADMGLLGKQPSFLDAFQVVYGLKPGIDGFTTLIQQIWKALPWSWFIDWFANISDALEVSRNLIHYKPSRINLMWETTKIATYAPLHPTGTRSFNGGSCRVVVKNRNQPSISSVTGVRLKLPFLDSFKLSVLGSLAVASLPGKRQRYV